MKFYRPGEGRGIVTSGTYLQGYVEATYQNLVDIFGNPTSDGDGYKVDAEWDLVFEDGTVATIYNYKEGKNYNGSSGYETEDITEWHIGGFDQSAVKRITATLEEEARKKDTLVATINHNDEDRRIKIVCRTGITEISINGLTVEEVRVLINACEQYIAQLKIQDK